MLKKRGSGRIPAILLRVHCIWIKHDVKSKTKAKIRTVGHKRSRMIRSPHLIPTYGSRKVIIIDMISTKVRKESLLRAEPTCTSKWMPALRPGRSTRWSLCSSTLRVYMLWRKLSGLVSGRMTQLDSTGT